MKTASEMNETLREEPSMILVISDGIPRVASPVAAEQKPSATVISETNQCSITIETGIMVPNP